MYKSLLLLMIAAFATENKNLADEEFHFYSDQLKALIDNDPNFERLFLYFERQNKIIRELKNLISEEKLHVNVLQSTYQCDDKATMKSSIEFLNGSENGKFTLIQREKSEKKIAEQSSVKYLNKNESRQNEVEECPICCDSIADYRDKLKTDCKHNYHFGCLKKLLANKNSCPQCKYEIQNVRAWISLDEFRRMKSRPSDSPHLQNTQQIRRFVNNYVNWIFIKSIVYTAGWLFWMYWGPRAFGDRWYGDDWHVLLWYASMTANLIVPLIYNRLLRAKPLIILSSALMYYGSLMWFAFYFDGYAECFVILTLVQISFLIDVIILGRRLGADQN